MERQPEPKWIFALQVASVSAIWVFVLGISLWIVHLLRLSHRLHDVPSASVGISIVAIPVFLTGASVLTYVFVGLRRGRAPLGEATPDAGGG
jgi:arginine exporter protein ArgO